MGATGRRAHHASMPNVVVTERTRFVLSWGVFLAFMSFVVIAAQLASTVALHTKEIEDAKASVGQSATKEDIKRLEDRIIRIESLLLSQQTRDPR